MNPAGAGHTTRRRCSSKERPLHSGPGRNCTGKACVEESVAGRVSLRDPKDPFPGKGTPLWRKKDKALAAFLAPGRFPEPRKTRQVQGKRGFLYLIPFRRGGGYLPERSAQKRFSGPGMKRRVARVLALTGTRPLASSLRYHGSIPFLPEFPQTVDISSPRPPVLK